MSGAGPEVGGFLSASGSAPVLVIGGPTASGKSGLALAVAEAFAGTVINADSMQVYQELRILTARPEPEDEARAPHRLYGVLSVSERGSVARWLELALAAVTDALAQGRLPVVVGGTGLYLRALLQGLAGVPPIPEAVRAAGRERLAALGGVAFRAALVADDPASARLPAADSQRLLRAWEVLEATGRPLSAWQAEGNHGPPAHWRFFPVRLLPPRPALQAAADARFVQMMAAGALAEARAMEACSLAEDLPAARALGLSELRACVRGELSQDEAVAAAQQATRRYAKRQETWFRHQMTGYPLPVLTMMTPQNGVSQIAQFLQSQ